jgi:hypothetical protein
VPDQYSLAEEWREQASYFEVPGANLYTELHRETGSAARVWPVQSSAPKRRSSSVGVPIRLFKAPGKKSPGAKTRVGQVEYLNIPLISQPGGIRLSLWSSKVHNMPSQAVRHDSSRRHSGDRWTAHFLLEGPQTINHGESASCAFRS